MLNRNSYLSPSVELQKYTGYKLKIRNKFNLSNNLYGCLWMVAGIWFDLTAKISAIDSAIVRLEYNQSLNDEFRIKWPRGEMGALPDDAKQDLRIEYLQKDVEKLILTIEELKEKINNK